MTRSTFAVDRAAAARTLTATHAAGPRRKWAAAFPLLSVVLLFAPGARLNAQQSASEPAGKATYDKWCAGCHGVDGKGAGSAANYLLPRPRDFTDAKYQIRTTATGELPTDADILRVIDEGMPGTSMPGWRTVLSQNERNQLVSYVKSFSRFFQNNQQQPQALTFGRAPRATEERLAEGKQFYDRIECWKCHGRSGRGDGPSAPTQEDDTKFPIRPADLTEPWYFNGGGTVEDIYRRLRTGLDGTPMPSFSDLVTSNFMTDDQLWNVALYVRSLAPEQFPRVRDVVRAHEFHGDLPTSPTDSAWNTAERFYIPLVGQIVVKPRWFAPTVDGVWLQALHNGTELAVRATWNDPSRSPDPQWDPWQQRIQQFMEPHEDAAATQPTGPQPDMLVLQFPPTIPTGMERPFFLMGTTGKPTYLWKWQSDTNTAVEALGKGYVNIEPLAGGQLTSSSSYHEGEWSVVFRRPIASADSANRLGFRTGVPIPMAVFAWDGNNSETGARNAISTWYYIYLDQKTPSTVYTAPVATIALTAGLGLLFVRRAQRRRDENGQ